MKASNRDFIVGASGKTAIDELGELVRIREQTKRMLVGAAVLLIIIAALVIVYAPPGQETFSEVFGTVLIIVALGALITVAFQFRSPIILLQPIQPGGDFLKGGDS